jgi:hypothetical protein
MGGRQSAFLDLHRAAGRPAVAILLRLRRLKRRESDDGGNATGGNDLGDEKIED